MYFELENNGTNVHMWLETIDIYLVAWLKDMSIDMWYVYMQKS